MGLAYRMRQFWMRLEADPASIDWPTVDAALDEKARELYRELSVGDQLHGLCVLSLLRASGEGPVSSALAQAALLHDVGKAHSGLNLARRSLIVLLRAVWPQALRWLGRPCADDSWRRAFHIHVHHAQIGADRCAEANLDADLVALVHHHESHAPHSLRPELVGLLSRLQSADDQC